MKIVTWNVNGLRAVVSKGFIVQVKNELGAPDIICLQETKAQDEQVHEALSGLTGYHVHSNSAEKKGYSGVATLSKERPASVLYGIGIDEHDREGRVLTCDFEHFIVVNVYTPNSQNGLTRLAYRREWDAAFRDYVKGLSKTKPVVVCGDLNVAHQKIDLARPEANYNKSAGFTQDEIDGLSSLLAAGFSDAFRMLHPEKVKYSWWSYRMNAREKNIGWRIDYFIVSQALQAKVKSVEVLDSVLGSDHCPVVLTW